MQFNSYEFILFFLPITVIGYFVLNRLNTIWGKIVIIIASIVFYSFGRVNMLIYLGVSLLINYFAACLIGRRESLKKLFLTIPIVVNIGLLLYFKYLNFGIENINNIFNKNIPTQNIVLPLGISFYTFQQIAYLVVVHQRKIEKNNLIDYLTYILYFPKLVMGPITDPVDFFKQLNSAELKKPNLINITIGIKLFSLGLIKKALLADTFAKAVSWGFNNIDTMTAMDGVLLVLFYTFEIYFDFSGYSDMAVGISKMFNIDLPMNFDSPYKALSIRDFWKRWHISLTKFLTTYIYIPLGGSRKGKCFTYINTMIVFLVSGLWHGANWTFVLWGILHGIFSCIDRIFDKKEEKIFTPVRWLGTFFVVSVLWLLFSSESISQWLQILSKIVRLENTTVSKGMIDVFNLPEFIFIYDIFRLNTLSVAIRGFSMLLFTLVASYICFVPQNNYRNKDTLNVGLLVIASISFVWGILCLGSESTFLYFGF